MNQERSALVVAGGQWQVPIIRYLKQHQYEVWVADPYDHSPGVLIADRHVKADVRDIRKIRELVGGHKFDLVTTDQSDISIETVTELSIDLGLNSNTMEAVQRFTNKLTSRQYALENGIPVPEFHQARNVAEVRRIISEYGEPMILKPVDSQSSRGIFKINPADVDDVERLAPLTFKESQKDYILVEAFFEGIELTVEGICSGGKHKTLAISHKKHFRTGIASDLIYPADLPSVIIDAITAANDDYVERSGLQFGITHAEYLYNAGSGRFVLVEIACRGGGTLISSDIAKWVSGVDIYAIQLGNLEGRVTDVKAIVPLKRPAILHFFEYPNGRVKSIKGMDAIGIMPGVVMIKLDFKEGDVIKAANDDRSRQGFVIILANAKEELDARLVLVNNTLKVEIENV